MGKYILRRLLQMIPVIIGVTFIIYVAVFALGDPTVGRCGERACPEGYIAKFRADYNLDKPLVVQYALYMGNLVQGDLGTNFFGNRVVDELATRWPTTLKLGLMAVFIETVIGISAGVLAGIRRGQFVDSLVTVSTLLLISIPHLRDRQLRSVDLRHPPGMVPGDRNAGYLVPADHARVRPGIGFGGLRRAADASQPDREPAGRLRAHRQSQGTDPSAHGRRAHVAQFPDPGRHLHRHRHRRSDGRCQS